MGRRKLSSPHASASCYDQRRPSVWRAVAFVRKRGSPPYPRAIQSSSGQRCARLTTKGSCAVEAAQPQAGVHRRLRGNMPEATFCPARRLRGWCPDCLKGGRRIARACVSRSQRCARTVPPSVFSSATQFVLNDRRVCMHRLALFRNAFLCAAHVFFICQTFGA